MEAHTDMLDADQLAHCRPLGGKVEACRGVASGNVDGRARLMNSVFPSDQLSERCVVRANEPLVGKTTLRVGGPADWYVEPATEEDLAVVVRTSQQRGIPLLLLGHGSNLLVRDGGVRGVVVTLRQPAFRSINVGEQTISCGAGTPLKEVARTACRHGISRFEFMDGIPGTVGGGLRTNAGAFGTWTSDVLESVRCMNQDGTIEERAVTGLQAGYRCSEYANNTIVLAAVFRGTPAPGSLILERMEEFRHRRRETQPREPSAGCVFKNAAAGPAGWLIDQVGLKGLRVGGAAVSRVHANFLINKGDATAKDMIQLIAAVRERVFLSRGITLETEVEIVGEDA